MKYRAIWISDVHLGSKGCKAEFLLDFLRSTESEHLYLVGDIIDLWAMRRGLYWPQTHNDVIRTVLGKAKRGTKVVYVPGNHDDPFRDYHGMTFGNVAIRRRAMHRTAHNRRLLVLHGDEFDSVIRYSRRIGHAGDCAYRFLLQLNRVFNFMRRTLGFPYWSLSAYIKLKVKNAVNAISNFEHAIAFEAARCHADGLVCGHIHHAEIKRINGVLYCNDGDWVESCTALVERHDGALEIIQWADEKQSLKLTAFEDIRIALRPGKRLRALLNEFSPHAIHLATEGPLGWAARRHCLNIGLKFTTSYHTRFPEYLRLRAPIPIGLTYACFRRFHSKAERTMVATESQRDVLQARGFGNLVLWSRGVDTALFHPRPRGFLSDRRPILTYVGRVAVEKNLEAFLSLDLPGTRYVIGDGPDKNGLSRKYPAVRFAGYKFGEELARYLADADVFVFPSLTDTFGVVMLEAMACGVPVAAFPVPGPRDVVNDGVTGALDEDLGHAISRALKLDRQHPRNHALSRSWQTATEAFRGNLAINF